MDYTLIFDHVIYQSIQQDEALQQLMNDACDAFKSWQDADFCEAVNVLADAVLVVLKEKHPDLKVPLEEHWETFYARVASRVANALSDPPR